MEKPEASVVKHCSTQYYYSIFSAKFLLAEVDVKVMMIIQRIKGIGR